MSLVQIVDIYSKRVQDGRTCRDIFRHLVGEVNELNQEIIWEVEGLPPGDDGVVGECIDVIACCIDIILQKNKNVPLEVLEPILEELMAQKCQKWVYKTLTGAYDLGR